MSSPLYVTARICRASEPDGNRADSYGKGIWRFRGGIDTAVRNGTIYCFAIYRLNMSTTRRS